MGPLVLPDSLPGVSGSLEEVGALVVARVLVVLVEGSALLSLPLSAPTQAVRIRLKAKKVEIVEISFFLNIISTSQC